MAKSRWYGSIDNRIMEQQGSAVEPVVGMPATITMYSDRHGATVTRIISKVRIEVTENECTKWDGEYGVEFGELRGEPRVCTKTKRGWQLKGGGAGILLGVRKAYHDRSF